MTISPVVKFGIDVTLSQNNVGRRGTAWDSLAGWDLLRINVGGGRLI